VQLLAQRYGSLPVAHRVGGFVDTIEDGVSGILFEPLEAGTLVAAARRARDLLAGADAGAWPSALMRRDVSWSEPARHWERLLAEASRERTRV
jgi:starch synthase